MAHYSLAVPSSNSSSSPIPVFVSISIDIIGLKRPFDIYLFLINVRKAVTMQLTSLFTAATLVVASTATYGMLTIFKIDSRDHVFN